MARARKVKSAPIADLNDPTPERERRDTFETLPAPRMSDEQIGRDKLVKVRRRVSPITRMEGGIDPWLTRVGATSIERFALLIEQAGYDCGSRGCLAMATGSSSAEFFDVKLDARNRHRDAAHALGSVDQTALQFLEALLAPANGDTVGELAQRLLVGGMSEARQRVQIAATVLSGHFAEQ